MSTSIKSSGNLAPTEIIMVTKEPKKKKKRSTKSHGDELSPWHVTAIETDNKPKERRVALTTEL